MTVDLHDTHRAAGTISEEAWSQAWQDHADGKATTLPLPDFPPEDVQRITNSLAGAATMAGAATFTRIVVDELHQRLAAPAESLRLLDFGAGWGRMIRLLLRTFPPESLAAVDVDERLVDAGRTTLPGIDFRRTESGGRLPFDDGAFDVIISNSVFSHLAPPLQMTVLPELVRVTRPGGLLFITTLAPRHYETWRQRDKSRDWITRLVGEEDEVRRALAAGEPVFGRTGRWPDYGITILPDGWTSGHWPEVGLAVLGTRTDYNQVVNIATPSASMR